MHHHGIAATALSGVAVAVLGATLLQAQTPKPPPGYFIAEFQVKDAEGFRQYAGGVPATLAPYGGRVLVRGGKIDKIAGDEPKGGPVVVLAFDSAEQARNWASSPEYTKLVPLRDKSANMRAFIIEGVAP